MSQVMAIIPTDESTSIPGGEPASAPRELRRQVLHAYHGRSVYIQIHQRQISQMTLGDAEQGQIHILKHFRTGFQMTAIGQMLGTTKRDVK